jgi:hypothetical protein
LDWIMKPSVSSSQSSPCEAARGRPMDALSISPMSQGSVLSILSRLALVWRVYPLTSKVRYLYSKKFSIEMGLRGVTTHPQPS